MDSTARVLRVDWREVANSFVLSGGAAAVLGLLLAASVWLIRF